MQRVRRARRATAGDRQPLGDGLAQQIGGLVGWSRGDPSDGHHPGGGESHRRGLEGLEG